ncbi:MAG: MmgE/PrpD family protein [Burkholderiales bacterium]
MRAESDLADFCVGLRAEGIPDEARKRAVDAITDCVACAIAGAVQPLAASVLKTIYTAPECPGMLIGAAQRAPAPDAALYNGAVAHALDYDDISHPAYSHPSAVLLPALLSCADHAQVTGRDVVTAYVIGIEVFGKLGRVLNLHHYKNGWHPTSTFGAIAASVAVGSLLRLSKPQLLSAIGLAASSSSDLRCNFGTMAKPVHAGYAARNGVMAALLARNDCEASPDALTHKYGFFSTFNGGAGISEEGFSGWGAPFEILTASGIGLKLYPSCAATHPAIEAAERHRRVLDGNVDAIRKVSVGMSEFATEPLIYVVPETPLQGKFSMHYCVAAALTREHVTLKTFSSDAIADPRTLALMDKIETYIDERVRDDHEFAAVVRVETTDGRTREELVRIAPGKPQRWFTRDQLERKFMDCCFENKGIRDAARVFELMQEIDSSRPLSEFARALSTSR